VREPPPIKKLIVFFFFYNGRGLGSRAKISLLQSIWSGQNKAVHWWRIEKSKIYMYLILITDTV
jgi:hypothetical protein